MRKTVHPSTVEKNANARVWRFFDRSDASDYAMFLDGHWNNVQGPIESFAWGATQSWVVFAWNPIGSIG